MSFVLFQGRDRIQCLSASTTNASVAPPSARRPVWPHGASERLKLGIDRWPTGTTRMKQRYLFEPRRPGAQTCRGPSLASLCPPSVLSQPPPLPLDQQVRPPQQRALPRQCLPPQLGLGVEDFNHILAGVGKQRSYGRQVPAQGERVTPKRNWLARE